MQLVVSVSDYFSLQVHVSEPLNSSKGQQDKRLPMKKTKRSGYIQDIDREDVHLFMVISRYLSRFGPDRGR